MHIGKAAVVNLPSFCKALQAAPSSVHWRCARDAAENPSRRGLTQLTKENKKKRGVAFSQHKITKSAPKRGWSQ